MSGSPTSGNPLTVFAIPRAFQGHIGVIQWNAITSWTRIRPRPDIILFGTDAGTAEVAAEFGVRHMPEVQRNQWGTPLVGDLLERAQTLEASATLCYVNSDIILFDDFADAVRRVATWSKRFLMVGRRTDVDIKDTTIFVNPDWAGQLRARATTEGK